MYLIFCKREMNLNDINVFLQAVAEIILSKYFSTKGVKPVSIQFN